MYIKQEREVQSMAIWFLDNDLPLLSVFSLKR